MYILRNSAQRTHVIFHKGKRGSSPGDWAERPTQFHMLQESRATGLYTKPQRLKVSAPLTLLALVRLSANVSPSSTHLTWPCKHLSSSLSNCTSIAVRRSCPPYESFVTMSNNDFASTTAKDSRSSESSPSLTKAV